MDDELLNKLEQERIILEDKVEHIRYGYIVTRKEYYRNLIIEMEELNLKLSQKIDQSNVLQTDLLNIDYDSNYLYDKLYEVVENTVKVDNIAIQRRTVPPQQNNDISGLPFFSQKEEKKNANASQRQEARN